MLRLGLVLLSLASLAAVPSAASASGDPSGCTRTRENQRVQLDGTVRKDTFTETYSGGGRPNPGSHAIADIPMGNVVIGATTCQAANGRWRVLSPVSVTATYFSMSPQFHITGGQFGWGLVPRTQLASSKSLAAGGIQLEATRCSKGALFSVARAIIGLPIPGLKYAVSVGQWLAGQSLPRDKTRCERLVTLDVPFTISRTGTLGLGSASNYVVYQSEDRGDIKVKIRMDATARAH